MPAKTSRDRGAEVRARIERAAMELVCEVGHGGVTTRLLAERAGVTPGLVHYHYRSIDDAVRTALMAAIDGLVAEFDRVIADVKSPEQAMGAVWSLLDPVPASGQMSVLALESVLASIRDPELRGRMAEAVDSFRQILETRLRDAGVDEPEATAAVLAAVIDGVMMHRIVYAGERSDVLFSEGARTVIERLVQERRSA